MDRAKADKIKQAALEALAHEFEGIVVTQKGAAKFDGGMVRVTFEFAEVGADGVVQSVEAAHWKKYAELFHKSEGLKAEWLGKQVRVGGKTFTITGLATRAQRNPVCADGNDGRKYHLPVAMVVQGMALAEATKGTT